jgi:long-chain acyl-CoA synthetase
VMRGYWGLPKETAKVLRPGHLPGELVLFTGDLFEKDKEGYLYFLGRKDDIIKTSGHMVSPKEVENVICEIDGVVEAAVIGVNDDIQGRSVKAFVCLADHSVISKEALLGFCRARLEDYAVPRLVEFCGPLPRNNSGKVQKQDLR